VGSLWVKVLVTVAAALAASVVSFMTRYRGKGRPFASGRSAGWSLATVALLAAVATGIGLGLPAVASDVPPFSLGLLIPALLCAAQAKKSETAGEPSAWFQVATAGVAILLDQLEQQMCADRDNWSEVQVKDNWTLDDLDEAAWHVHGMLVGRVTDRSRTARLRSDFDEASQAVRDAYKTKDDYEARHARYRAEQALIKMLGRAWEWGYTDITTTRSSPPQATDADAA
jgi:hypothetical protein